MKITAIPLIVALFLTTLSNLASADLVAEWVSFSGGLPALANNGAQQDSAAITVDPSHRGRFWVVAGDSLRLAGNQIGWEGTSLGVSFGGDLFKDFVLTFDVTGEPKATKTPPDTIEWYLSADGGAFNYVGSNSINVNSNNGLTLDLTGNAVANAALSLVLQAKFRNPDNGNGPALVFDNVRINAVAVPEPTAFWFLGLASAIGGGYGCCRRWPS